jgi:hypothetical protein
MVTTTAAVTNTMQIVEYHEKHNTTIDQAHLKQTTVVVGVRVNLNKGYLHSNKSYLKHIVRVLLDHGHNRHLVFVTKDKPILCPYSNRLVSQS